MSTLAATKATNSSIVDEINELTSKGKAPSPFDLLQGKASKSEKESGDFEDVLKALSTLSLNRSDKGELVPAVMINKRLGTALKKVATYSLSESPAKLCERLELIRPFFLGQCKAPLGARAKAQDTYMKICAQLSFILMRTTFDLADWNVESPEKEPLKQKQLTLFKQLQTHTAVIEKTFKTTFAIMQRAEDNAWMIKIGPLTTYVDHIFKAVMPPAE